MSTPIVTRADFQSLADQRLVEAKFLLDHGQWDGAYYLAGYAVELGLRACIIKTLLATDAFPEKKFSENCYTHAIDRLVGLAKLELKLQSATAADPDLQTNWSLTLDWNEAKRYHRMAQAEAEMLYNAIADPLHGVLPWIKTHY
jgi:HEPN domain-containing protein